MSVIHPHKTIWVAPRSESKNPIPQHWPPERGEDNIGCRSEIFLLISFSGSAQGPPTNEPCFWAFPRGLGSWPKPHTTSARSILFHNSILRAPVSPCPVAPCGRQRVAAARRSCLLLADRYT